MIKYSNAENYVDTSDAYSKQLLLGNGNIVVPYINIELLTDNPVQSANSNIDYSYCVFIEVSKLIINSRKGGIIQMRYEQNLNMPEITEFIYFGGYEGQNSAEIEIHCRMFSYYLPEKFQVKTAQDFFIPRTTPMFRQNMIDVEVERFLNFDTKPIELIDLLGSQYSSIVLQ
jgi:hypothetical protein